MVDSLRQRLPGLPIVHASCRVQGSGASAEIAEAIRQLDQDPRVETIIVGRGGGSLEDLWAFNEETTVRAIARCRTPIISAVGHETDHSLLTLRLMFAPKRRLLLLNMRFHLAILFMHSSMISLPIYVAL